MEMMNLVWRRFIESHLRKTIFSQYYAIKIKVYLMTFFVVFSLSFVCTLLVNEVTSKNKFFSLAMRLHRPHQVGDRHERKKRQNKCFLQSAGFGEADMIRERKTIKFIVSSRSCSSVTTSPACLTSLNLVFFSYFCFCYIIYFSMNWDKRINNSWVFSIFMHNRKTSDSLPRDVENMTRRSK